MPSAHGISNASQQLAVLQLGSAMPQILAERITMALTLNMECGDGVVALSGDGDGH